MPVASSANSVGIAANCGSKPGAKRATLAAGCVGNPVCIASHTTHTMKPAPLKNNSANQSIKALARRLSVGSAKLANTARLGSVNNTARSGRLDSMAVKNVMALNNSGSQICGERHWARHRHKAHSASGPAGHRNHTNSFNQRCHPRADSTVNW